MRGLLHDPLLAQWPARPGAIPRRNTPSSQLAQQSAKRLQDVFTLKATHLSQPQNAAGHSVSNSMYEQKTPRPKSQPLKPSVNSGWSPGPLSFQTKGKHSDESQTTHVSQMQALKSTNFREKCGSQALPSVALEPSADPARPPSPAPEGE